MHITEIKFAIVIVLEKIFICMRLPFSKVDNYDNINKENKDNTEKSENINKEIEVNNEGIIANPTINPSDLIKPFNQEIISNQLSTIETMLYSMQSSFETHSQIILNKEKLIAQLFEKIQNYEDDFVFNKFQKGFILDIISLIDNLEEISIIAHKSKNDTFINAIKIIQNQLIKTLQKNGVERINETEGIFSEFYQRAIDVIITDQPNLNDYINHSVRAGYRKCDGMVIRPQDVVITKFSEKGE